MKDEELDQIINRSLKAEPSFQLSADFARKVVAAVVTREQWKSNLREYISISAVLIGLLAVVGGFFYFVDKAIVEKTFQYFLDHPVPVILIVFLLNFVFFADRVLLRLLFDRWSDSGPKS